ncbi:uncharacterized protein LOC125956808 isoform X2 [Anopheles darlingi]|uniref:uncharacterized protein LOC125956808 isoform X2 n=1 Tax=Anopheles darlingi TaxID=43151 RepID=UPI0021002012|nr:uncharacterized protein LOC125956808 isoform X2 [Anopheles darlingi]
MTTTTTTAMMMMIATAPTLFNVCAIGSYCSVDDKESWIIKRYVHLVWPITWINTGVIIVACPFVVAILVCHMPTVNSVIVAGRCRYIHIETNRNPVHLGRTLPINAAYFRLLHSRTVIVDRINANVAI